MSKKSEKEFLDIVKFTRVREYAFVRELGSGSTGTTVLLLDESIKSFVVCKKYTPCDESDRDKYFDNFCREIQLMYKFCHENVVKVYNHYLYPGKFGYIVMEYIEGVHINEYLEKQPQSASSLFEQAIQGFSHLESKQVLHRDIRAANIMVSEEGVLKIIDFGFGKSLIDLKDNNKSLSLNWAYPIPDEFSKSIYNFSTEVYFVGKLFDELTRNYSDRDFKYKAIIAKMCERNPSSRYKSFMEVRAEMLGKMSVKDDGVSEDDLRVYRDFADNIREVLAEIDSKSQFVEDEQSLVIALGDVIAQVEFERFIPNPTLLLGKLVRGHYRYMKRIKIEVAYVSRFFELLKNSSHVKQKRIYASLIQRLNAIPKFDNNSPDDNIPF